jgi:hypothetical protein
MGKSLTEFLLLDPMATGTAPPPPGSPVKTLPNGQRVPEIPPGVPEYNFRMCQNDIIKMGQAKPPGTLTVENTAGGKSKRNLSSTLLLPR